MHLPYRLVQFCLSLKNLLVLIYSKLHSNHVITYTKFEKQNKPGGKTMSVENNPPNNRAHLFKWEKFLAWFPRSRLQKLRSLRQTIYSCEDVKSFLSGSRDVLRSGKRGKPSQTSSYKEAFRGIRLFTEVQCKEERA